MVLDSQRVFAPTRQNLFAVYSSTDFHSRKNISRKLISAKAKTFHLGRVSLTFWPFSLLGFGREVVGSDFRSQKTFSMRLESSTHVKRVSQRSAESRGFSPGTPVSSHRES
jgi:hypothetical protein